MLLASYLGASVGTGEQDAGDLAREGTSVTRAAEGGQGGDGGDGKLLLVEASLGEGHKGREDESLGHGCEGIRDEFQAGSGYTENKTRQTELRDGCKQRTELAVRSE